MNERRGSSLTPQTPVVVTNTVSNPVPVTGSVSVTPPDDQLVHGPTTDNGPAWATTHTITSGNLSSLTDVTAAPTSGQKVVITDVLISASAAMTVTLKEETSADVYGGPYYLPANGTLPICPRGKWKLGTANKKLRAIASVASAVTIEVYWYSEA